MLLRRTLPFAIAALAFACEPSVPHCVSASSTDPACKGSFNPSTVDYAAFDLTSAQPDIPLPNDLALQSQAIATQTGAQQELLKTFVDDKGQEIGFPNDQEVPITIDFVRQTIDPNTGQQTASSLDLDLTSINKAGATPDVVVLSLSATSFGAPIPIEQPAATDYVKGTDRGTLTLHKKVDPKNKTRRWAPGQYVVAVRGGANGVQVTGSTAGVNSAPAMFLLLQGKRLTDAENLTLIPGNSAAEKASNAALLEQLRQRYLLPLVVINGVFPQQEVAVLATFLIDPRTHVETAKDIGVFPLPSAFLTGADGKLLPQLANPAGPFGPLGPGLGTLDGFSTTAMILAQTSGPFDATTVRGNVFLLERGATGYKRLAELSEIAAGKQPRFVAEPDVITQVAGAGRISTAIGLQPAVPVQLPASLPAPLGGKFVPLPPLAESTEYAVIVTDGVKDLGGRSFGPSTAGRLLLFQNSLVSGAHSTVPGLSDADAPGLEFLRLDLQPALAALLTDKGISKDHVVMAYTFRTQSITPVATQLGALPYNPAFPTALTAALAGPVPGRTASFCTATLGGAGPACTGFGPGTGATDINGVWGRYGVDPAVIPNNKIGGIVESAIVTPELFDPKTGAFSNPPTPVPVGIRVLISVPKIPVPTPGVSGPGCVPAAGAPCPVPLVIFRHGVFGSRDAMLTVANELAANGFAVAAIDAAKQGDRSLCSDNSQCITGATCVQDASLAGQGDAAGATPGICNGPVSLLANPANNGSFYLNKPFCDPTSTSCSGAAYVPNAGTPAVSGNFLISGNLFRTRDTFRQDIIDQSQLVHVLGLDPTHPPAPAQPQDSIFYSLAGNFGVVIDPRKIYFLGQSLGSIQGTVDVAANPRIGKAVLNVGGGTIVDIFTAPSSSLSNRLNALLVGLGIMPGTPAYLQFINVAKWILDPADPINFASHLIASPLPNLLPPLGGNPDGSVPQAAKKILGQIANCDATVPNPFNLLLYGLAGLGPESATAATQTVFFYPGNAGATPTAPCAIPGGGPVPHGFITSWGAETPPTGAPATYQMDIATLTKAAQDDAAKFLYSDIHPAPAEHP